MKSFDCCIIIRETFVIKTNNKNTFNFYKNMNIKWEENGHYFQSEENRNQI